MKKLILAALLAGGVAVPAMAVDIDGKLAVCAGCHGKNGNSSIPSNPVLAGQYRSYLVKSLQDYKTGKRNNPVMKGQAAALSDDEINAIAVYFSQQDSDLESSADVDRH